MKRVTQLDKEEAKRGKGEYSFEQCAHITGSPAPSPEPTKTRFPEDSSFPLIESAFTLLTRFTDRGASSSERASRGSEFETCVPERGRLLLLLRPLSLPCAFSDILEMQNDWDKRGEESQETIRYQQRVIKRESCEALYFIHFSQTAVKIR